MYHCHAVVSCANPYQALSPAFIFQVMRARVERLGMVYLNLLPGYVKVVTCVYPGYSINLYKVVHLLASIVTWYKTDSQLIKRYNLLRINFMLQINCYLAPISRCDVLLD